MDLSTPNASQSRKSGNQNIQVYVRVRPLNTRERCNNYNELVEVISPREILTRHSVDSKLTKKFTFDRTFGPESRQVDVYTTVVGPLIEEVLQGYNCTVFAYGQTGTGKTYTMVGPEITETTSTWDDNSHIGIIPRALSHLFEELRLMELDFSMRISYLELYNEELCDLLSSDDSTKIRIFEDSTKKGSVIIQGLEEIPVHSKDDVYKLLEKGKERRRTAATLMNAQSSRSHTVFSILVHIRENGIDGEEMLKIGKLNLVDLAGSENVTKAGNEGKRARETVNINQSLLTLGRVIMALVERTPHVPYRESKLTRLLQESLGGRTKTSIIATISPGHRDIEETLNTLEYAHRAKNIQNKPEVNQKLTKKVMLKEYTEEIDKLKRDLMAARDRNGIYLAEETYYEMNQKMDSQNRELNEKVLLLKALRDEMLNKEKIFNEVSLTLVKKSEELMYVNENLEQTKGALKKTAKVLDTTKRCYNMKKALLQSHIKTEQELTEQATQILKVADIATNDTQQLHNTIERRKDVDRKIETVCEKFSKKMHENFELMNDQLSSFRRQHENCSDLLLEEIANGQKIQNEMLSDARTNIAAVHDAYHKLLDDIGSARAEFMSSLVFLTDDHKAAVMSSYENLLKRETEIRGDIQMNLEELQAIYGRQKHSLDAMRKSVIKASVEQARATERYAIDMEQRLTEVMKISAANIGEWARVQQEMTRERELAGEEEQAMSEFLQKMIDIKKERSLCSDRLQALAGQGRVNTHECVTRLQHNIDNVREHNVKQSTSYSATRVEVEQQIDDVLRGVDQGMAKCSTVETQLDNMLCETGKQIKRCSDQQVEQADKERNIVAEFEAQVKRLRLDGDPQVAEAFTAIGDGLQSGVDRLATHANTASALSQTLDQHVEDYKKIYGERMEQCREDVDTFRESELKTYKPTGTTPSKKEFRYPRSLVQTLPHSQILRQFRQDNDMSDFDTTITIEEDSEGEHQNSVRCISPADVVLNSTPILGREGSVQDQQQQPQQQQLLAMTTTNTLKPSNFLRSSSLNKSDNSDGSKRTSSPDMNVKENKENLSA